MVRTSLIVLFVFLILLSQETLLVHQEWEQNGALHDLIVDLRTEGRASNANNVTCFCIKNLTLGYLSTFC